LIAPYEGVVMDVGTGDGRFVSSRAREYPNKYVIGVDANAKPLQKLSIRATRKPSKGGLPNAMFVQAAVESLPEEFAGVAREIHVNFPWGSLLRAVAVGDADVLASLRVVARDGSMLNVVIGIDPERDRAELERLGIAALSLDSVRCNLLPRYEAAGFENIECRELEPEEWSGFSTSWAKRLSGNESRQVFLLRFQAI
jgi:16S rRNA (adenine(1408)-N(1))-methyltransferase